MSNLIIACILIHLHLCNVWTISYYLQAKTAGLRIIIYEAFCLDVAQGRMNGAPNETRTHSLQVCSSSLLTITLPETPRLSLEYA